MSILYTVSELMYGLKTIMNYEYKAQKMVVTKKIILNKLSQNLTKTA